MGLIKRCEDDEYVERMWTEAISWAAAGQLPKVYVRKIVELVEADCAADYRGAVEDLEALRAVLSPYSGFESHGARIQRAREMVTGILTNLGGQ
jgi:hypothetical protein